MLAPDPYICAFFYEIFAGLELKEGPFNTAAPAASLS